MKERMSFAALPQGLVKAMMTTETYLRRSKLPRAVVELVRMRVSQLNRCAYCLDMHHKEAVHHGVSLIQLYTLPAWRHSPAYDSQQRLALELAEALTMLATADPAPGLVERAIEELGPTDFADLCLVITQINSWNRLVAACGFTPGEYQVAA